MCRHYFANGLFSNNVINTQNNFRLWYILNRAYSNCEPQKEYKGYFSQEGWPKDPNKIFKAWIEGAQIFKPPKPFYMTMATVTSSCVPAMRMITISKYFDKGIIFFTSYCSDKAKDLEQNPYCALHVWWEDKQIRVQGSAYKLSPESNDKYTKKMSPQKRILGHLKQSEPVKGKIEILQEVVGLIDQYKPLQKIPRPPNWGGYILKPFAFEFFEARKNLLHDRVKFLKDGHPFTDQNDCVTYKGDEGWEYKWLTP